MTRRGRSIGMPSGRLTFSIHNLYDSLSAKSPKTTKTINFAQNFLKENFKITEKRPQAVGGGNLDSGHEATIESLLGLVEIFFQDYTKFWKFFYEMEMVTYCLSIFYLHTYSN